MEKRLNLPKLRFPEFLGEWVDKKLGSFAEVSAGATPSTMNKSYWGGTIRWMNSGELNIKKIYEVENRITDVGLRNSSTKIIPKYCILIGLAGQGRTRGTVAMNMVELCTNQSIASVLPNLEEYISGFLYHNLDKRYDELRSLSTGDGGRGGLNLQIIKSLKVFLPSIPEQLKIADLLFSVDDKISQLQKKKSFLELYKKGVIQQLFSQELRFKDDDGNNYSDWEAKLFGDVFSFFSTNSYSRDNLNYEDGTVKNIHYGDIHTKFKSHFDITKEYVPYLNKEISLHKLSDEQYCKEGDLIIADASEDYTDIGKSIELVNVNSDKVVAGLHTLHARPDLQLISIGFSGHLMKSENVRTQIMTIAQGTKVLSITTNRIGKVLIPIPTLPEQVKIASFLSALDDKIAQTALQIEKMQTWKKGLLQQMFV